MKKRKKNDKLLIVFIILAIFWLIFSTFLIYSKYLAKEKKIREKQIPLIEVTDEKIKEALSIEGFQKVINFTLSDVGNNVEVKLRTNCYELIGYIDEVQANSIRIALNQTKRIRPTTHDLMKDIFDSIGVKFVLGKIVGAVGGNYIGLLVVSQNNKTYVIVDARPSDIMALALRYNETIYISENLLKERGRYIC
ncbi:MAG: bifunctional nuclease family protein [Candidatus Aenigmarchaeota archaeon]|nr:bifunctional nuclease family protein [Candidatus Aenigmarchaeota archaeon]MDW8149517.1 bifunctional nuclease family protein [Candidatus Aenigmarchaeota archaeon]